MEWLVDVQVASRGCGSPVCIHTSRLGTAVTAAGSVAAAVAVALLARQWRWHQRGSAAAAVTQQRQWQRNGGGGAATTLSAPQQQQDGGGGNSAVEALA